MIDRETTLRKWQNQWNHRLANVASAGNLQPRPNEIRKAVEVLLVERGWYVDLYIIGIEPIDGQSREALVEINGEELWIKFEGDGGFSHAMLLDESALKRATGKGEVRRLDESAEGASTRLIEALDELSDLAPENWLLVLDAIANAPRYVPDRAWNDPWYFLDDEGLRAWALGTHPECNVKPIGFDF